MVGFGAAGSAAAWQLAARGRHVLALDRHHPPHALGASHGHTRMTRTAYYEHPGYVPMLLRSHELWRRLEADTSESLLHLVVGLYMGPEDSPLIVGASASARAHGLPVEVLGPEDLARRFPQFTAGPGAVGLLERHAGYLMVERCVGAMVHAAMSAGAECVFGAEVTGIEVGERGVRVIAGGRAWEAEHVVVTLGPWLSRLMPDLPAVAATRQTLGWFWPERPAAFRDVPVWAFDLGGGDLLYGFPMRADRPGLKAAVHAVGPRTDPDRVDRRIAPEDEAALRRVLEPRVSGMAGAACLGMTVCLYENSPDGHFLLGRVSPRVLVAGGLSRHGFKFSPVLGEILAELAVDGGDRSRFEIGFLHPSRFGVGAGDGPRAT